MYEFIVQGTYIVDADNQAQANEFLKRAMEEVFLSWEEV